ncbi:porin [Halomonas sp. DP8Y7-3]|uniref:DcaP family trimeric outer membrane transporter n=1 Tax=Halomonas sp. DP8Y7-3 TaxID=2859079 RepID=UPI001C97BB91|nr:DcaP family trimeric outer membrane transporter [Halomonas sp. DP8Y7-3]MBY5928862.1 porin [Halomonas sp. DP8Y7-3]
MIRRCSSGPLRSPVMLSPVVLSAAMLTGVSVLAMVPMKAVAQTTMQELNELKAQIELLKQQQQAAMALVEQQQAQIDSLISQQTHMQHEVAEVSDSVVRRTDDGDFLVGETTVAIGGYIKAQAAFSDNGLSDGKANETVTAGLLRATDDDKDNRVSLSARETRFNIGTSTPVGGDTMNTFIEMDFYGADDEANEFVSNSYAPRLRHAYLSWGNWLAGQTWSTFMDVKGLGELDAFSTHTGSIFVRQPQLRYTYPLDWGNLQFAVENPEDGDDDQDTPDMVARVNVDQDWGHVSAATVVRRFSLDDAEDDDSRWGAGYSLTGRFPVFEKDDLMLQANYGNLGRYMALGAYPNAKVEDGQLKMVESWGASAIYRHYWTDTLRSSVAYSATELDSHGSGNDTDSYDSVFLNLMWSPFANTTLSAEYQRYDLDEVDGDTFDLDRVQLSAKYDF